MKRKLLVAGWLLVIATAISGIFWYNDWRYSLPTPIPQNYQPVKTGGEIKISWALNRDSAKPLFLHFFNPDCPCSKFNVNHFKSLVKEYQGRVNFAIVVMSSQPCSIKDIQQRFETSIPVYADSAIAAACGVIATPQAAIIDARHRLWYRGNYNRSRYCTDKKTEYAKAALDALLQHENIIYEPLAVTAYGCQLPKCTR